MMNLLLVSGLVAALVVLLWLASRRRGGEPSGPPDASEYLVRLPPRGLLGRCFSPEDFAFVDNLRLPAVSGLLFQERRFLAMQWLRITRREAGRLYALHVRAARYAPDLRPAAEAVLFAHYTLFLFVYRIMMTLVWLYGPLRAHALVRSVQGLAGVLGILTGRIVDSITPVPAPTAAAATRGIGN